MRPILAGVGLALALLANGGAIAAEQRVTLRLENMYCVSCPYIVKQSLARVAGVSNVEISYEEEAAVAVAIVDFEDNMADVAALTAATPNVGFPAKVVR